MIKGDMEQKRRLSMQIIQDAIKAHHGTTIAFTGMVGDDARIGLAAVEAGARILEPNHGDYAMAIGFMGVKSMNETVPVRDLIPVEEMAKVVKGVRNVVGPGIYICVGTPGSFTAPHPVVFKEEHGMMLSLAGANGLHTHKSTLEDLRDIVDIAHYCGLLVDAYIAHPKDQHIFGIPAETPAEVAKTAEEMEAIGVDMIGLMTGMSYQGASAGEISQSAKERLQALIKAVKVPTIAEGGINLANYKTFIEMGVNILVVGTSINDAVKGAVRQVTETLLAR